MQGESNEALATYEGAKIISDVDTTNALNLKLATDTYEIYAAKQNLAVAQQLKADNKAADVIQAKKTREEAGVIATAAQEEFTVKETAVLKIQ